MMNEKLNKILLGIKSGDQIGGPYKLAKILSQSLKLNNGLYEDDLRKNIWIGGRRSI